MSVCLDFSSLNAYTIGVDIHSLIFALSTPLTDCASSWSFFICQPFGQAAEPQAARCTAEVPFAINVMLGGAGVREIQKEKKKEREMKKYIPRCLLLI